MQNKTLKKYIVLSILCFFAWLAFGLWINLWGFTLDPGEYVPNEIPIVLFVAFIYLLVYGVSAYIYTKSVFLSSVPLFFISFVIIGGSSMYASLFVDKDPLDLPGMIIVVVFSCFCSTVLYVIAVIFALLTKTFSRVQPRNDSEIS